VPATYAKAYAAQPDFSLQSDANCVVGLPGDRLEGRPLSATAKSEVLILGVRTAASRGFVFVAA
jgi:hypothetical protein